MEEVEIVDERDWEEGENLKSRPRRSISSNGTRNSKDVASIEVMRDSAEEIRVPSGNVYFDNIDGIMLTDQNAGKEPFKISSLGEEYTCSTNDLNIQKASLIDDGKNSEKIMVENFQFEESRGNEIVEISNLDGDHGKIKELSPMKTPNSSKIDVEFDIEKVLKEQVTHDLYCPNCNSCITRRVILRKRKRMVTDHLYDTMREKVETLQTDADPSSSAVLENVGTCDDGPEIFRCLSCLSFFIPTGTGSKLFRIFERRGTDKSSQKDEQIPLLDDTKAAAMENMSKDVAGPLTIEPNFEHNMGYNSDSLTTPEIFNQEKDHLGTEERENVIIDVREEKSEPLGAIPSSSENRKVPLPVIGQLVQPGAVVDGTHGTRRREWDILKSIIYGGLVESVMSLCVVTSAAGSGATTLNILSLAVANLFGGFFIIAHNLAELKNNQYGNTTETDAYQGTLGKRENFRRHSIVVILSYLICGALPPITYGFTFWKSDDKEYKLFAVAVVSFICIATLSIGKAHTQTTAKSYLKTLIYYIVLGIMSSGLSYAMGNLFKRLIQKYMITNAAIPVFLPTFSDREYYSTSLIKLRNYC